MIFLNHDFILSFFFIGLYGCAAMSLILHYSTWIFTSDYKSDHLAPNFIRELHKSKKYCAKDNTLLKFDPDAEIRMLCCSAFGEGNCFLIFLRDVQKQIDGLLNRSTEKCQFHCTNNLRFLILMLFYC